jgi:Ca-activated chloride channel homolog
MIPNARRSPATGLVFAVLFQVAGAAQAPDTQDYRVALEVDLVELHATVVDRKGRPVSGLGREYFAVHEDGVRQDIRLFLHEDTPVAVGLVVDHSGSVGRKLPEVIGAARTFARLSHPQDQIFVVNFNEYVTLGLPPPLQFTNRADEIERAISGTRTTGRTALYDAILEARKRLQAASLDKKALIVISDGGDNASIHSLAEVLAMVRQSSALIYTIGIFDADDPDRNPGVLRRVARATGGEAYFPEKLSDVVEIASRISGDIRNRYTIGYISSSAARPGAFRRIRVTVNPPGLRGLSVRAREGYVRVAVPDQDAK